MPQPDMRVWEDIGYFAVLTKQEQYYADFAVYTLLSMEGGKPVANKKESINNCEPADSLEDAQIFLSGEIKGDGCSNWKFDEQERCMLHFCGVKSAMALGALMERLYQWASEVIPTWDGE